MALPEFIKAQVEKKIQKLADDRIPEHVKDKVDIGYKIRGNAVTIIEKRFIPSQNTWAEIPIAKIKYDVDSSKWFLYVPNRNNKWFNYFEYYKEDKKPKEIDIVMEEIDKDSQCAFWG